MRLASLLVHERPCLAAGRDGVYVDLTAADPTLGSDVGEMLASGPDWRLRAARAVPHAPALGEGLRFRPLVPRPPKVLCLGLNDVDHAAEAGLPVPEVPVVFARVASSLIGHGEPMVRPVESDMLDYEVELAVADPPGEYTRKTTALIESSSAAFSMAFLISPLYAAPGPPSGSGPPNPGMMTPST